MVALMETVCGLMGTCFGSERCSGHGGAWRWRCWAFWMVDMGGLALWCWWRIGTAGIATAYALMNTVVITPVRIIVVTRLLGYRLRLLANKLRGVTEATAFMAASTFVVRQLLELHDVGAAGRLPICIVVGIVAYTAICRWREPRVFAELKRMRS